MEEDEAGTAKGRNAGGSGGRRKGGERERERES
jgi:hypothetical protein